MTNASATRSAIAGGSDNCLSFAAVDGGLFPMLDVGVAAGSMAALLPSPSASRVDPMVAIRSE